MVRHNGTQRDCEALNIVERVLEELNR
jgi:hypothetical protein